MSEAQTRHSFKHDAMNCTFELILLGEKLAAKLGPKGSARMGKAQIRNTI